MLPLECRSRHRDPEGVQAEVTACRDTSGSSALAPPWHGITQSIRCAPPSTPPLCAVFPQAADAAHAIAQRGAGRALLVSKLTGKPEFDRVRRECRRLRCGAPLCVRFDGQMHIAAVSAEGFVAALERLSAWMRVANSAHIVRAGQPANSAKDLLRLHGYAVTRCSCVC